MISFLILMAQLASWGWSAYVMFTGVVEPVQAYQVGAVQATADGFWWPVIRDAIQSSLFAVLAMYAPQWRTWLAKIKAWLPDNAPQTAGQLLQQLVDAAAAESIANAKEEVRLMQLRLKGEAIPPFVPVTKAKEALDLAKASIAAAS